MRRLVVQKEDAPAVVPHSRVDCAADPRRFTFVQGGPMSGGKDELVRALQSRRAGYRL